MAKISFVCPISDRVQTFAPPVHRTLQPATFSQLGDICLGSFCHDLWEQGHFTPGVRAENLGANFKHFLAFCLTPRVAYWLPKFYGTRFFSLGANARP